MVARIAVHRPRQLSQPLIDLVPRRDEQTENLRGGSRGLSPLSRLLGSHSASGMFPTRAFPSSLKIPPRTTCIIYINIYAKSSHRGLDRMCTKRMHGSCTLICHLRILTVDRDGHVGVVSDCLGYVHEACRCHADRHLSHASREDIVAVSSIPSFRGSRHSPAYFYVKLKMLSLIS